MKIKFSIVSLTQLAPAISKLQIQIYILDCHYALYNDSTMAKNIFLSSHGAIIAQRIWY